MSLTPQALALLENGDYENPNSPLNLPCYRDNVLTKTCADETGRLPLPLAVYVDGVRFTALQAGRSDSILVATCVNLLTNKRHVIGVLRQLDMCRCGCNGWCSVFVFLSYIAWVIGALVQGKVPDTKWDGSDWADGEERGAMNGQHDFGFRCMLLYVKGDWSEFAKTFGLGSRGKILNPCPICTTDKPNMHACYDCMNTGGVMFTERTLLDYERACKKCEIDVRIDSEDVRIRVVRAL
eukprot:8635183-Pyramimonas_sp.AAC.1